MSWESPAGQSIMLDANGSGGVGGGTYVPTWPSDLVLLQDIGEVITNIESYLECFVMGQPGKITIYVDQPKNNSPDTYSVNVFEGVNVGHTFISIQQGGNIKSFGFYPDGGVRPLSNPSADPILKNDSGHKYNVKIEVNASGSQISAVLNAAKSYGQTGYNLNSYNCTDFGMAISAAAGISLPDTNGSWPGGGGSNPGNLGQDIRNMQPNSNYNVSDSPGNAPTNSGNCN
jgi:hypothetical protein